MSDLGSARSNELVMQSLSMPAMTIHRQAWSGAYMGLTKSDASPIRHTLIPKTLTYHRRFPAETNRTKTGHWGSTERNRSPSLASLLLPYSRNTVSRTAEIPLDPEDIAEHPIRDSSGVRNDSDCDIPLPSNSGDPESIPELPRRGDFWLTLMTEQWQGLA